MFIKHLLCPNCVSGIELELVMITFEKHNPRPEEAQSHILEAKKPTITQSHKAFKNDALTGRHGIQKSAPQLRGLILVF